MTPIITLEGIDGSGKSTICNMIKEKLKNNDKILISKFPNDKYEVEIKKMLQTNESESSNFEVSKKLVKLFLDNFEYYSKNIMDKYDLCIFDRYIMSYFAYQSMNLSKEYVIEEFKKRDIRIPDLVIHLDIKPTKSMDRLVGSGRKESDKFFENISSLMKIDYNYKYFYFRNKEAFYKTLCDFDVNDLSIEEVYKKVITAIGTVKDVDFTKL